MAFSFCHHFIPNGGQWCSSSHSVEMHVFFSDNVVVLKEVGDPGLNLT